MLSLCQQNNSNLPSGPLSAKVQSNSGLGIAVAVNQADASSQMSYSSFAQPSKTVILPRLAKSADAFRSGLQAQNTGAQNTTPTITYYYADGTVALAATMGTIQPGQSSGVYLPNVSNLPDGFQGSAVITADQPLVAIGTATCYSGCSGDVAYSYNGVNR
jgi:hypothetical protein